MGFVNIGSDLPAVMWCGRGRMGRVRPGGTQFAALQLNGIRLWDGHMRTDTSVERAPAPSPAAT